MITFTADIGGFRERGRDTTVATCDPGKSKIMKTHENTPCALFQVSTHSLDQAFKALLAEKRVGSTGRHHGIMRPRESLQFAVY